MKSRPYKLYGFALSIMMLILIVHYNAEEESDSIKRQLL